MSARFSGTIYADEAQVVESLLDKLSWDDKRAKRVHKAAVDLVNRLRKGKGGSGQLEAFLQQYSLNTPEGLALMSLAEALLRIPDSATVDDLIDEKIAAANWLAGMAESKGKGNWMTKAAGLGLSLTQKTLNTKGLSKMGKPIIREATIQAIRILGRQFVLGQTIEEAFKRGSNYAKQGYRFSFDMLGEGARTRADAQKYYQAYADAIDAIGTSVDAKTERASGISVKLSALHPRYEYAQRDICVPELTEKLNALATKAAGYEIALTVDAEEVDRLEISLDIIEAVIQNPALQGWDGFGLAIQAYQKRCLPLIEHLTEVTRKAQRKIRVRLVKGAYWDTEVKRAQEMGLSDYPVFTRKANTDVSYLACANALFEHQDVIFPMFATHNAHSMMAVLEMGQGKDYELQRLHGMGEGLYDALKAKEKDVPVTIYAPVGSHSDLLPYLVRRLLENGANSSFVNKLLDPNIPAEDIVADPVAYVRALENLRHSRIHMPKDLYQGEAPNGRVNSHGFDITEPSHVDPVLETVRGFDDQAITIGSIIDGRVHTDGDLHDSVNPANISDVVARYTQADEADTMRAFEVAHDAFEDWNNTDADTRAAALEKFGDLLEAQENDFIALLVREAGKTIEDAHDEVREAIDFARYYANRGRHDFAYNGHVLPGPTGESNKIYMRGRGVFAAIAPWNFPLAIFTGQVLAALMAGNSVIAKPAELTPLIAFRAVELMHKAGIPKDVLHLVTARGSTLGKVLGQTPYLGGVAFTGSTAVAQVINKTLAARENSPIVPLIAETGGMNAMIVDSSALSEQVVDDVIRSAFGSAGQRCSALRILCLQDEIADKVIEMLQGAMAELRMGHGGELSTDVGPVIDDNARAGLQAHIDEMKTKHKTIYEVALSESLKQSGYFLAPIAFELSQISDLESEQFGPILHVVRYKKADIDSVFDQINASGYGLTFGVHSRLERFQQRAAHAIKAGNIYVNRSMTGAVVGVQPFGGQGLSGTGPKAGGPRYLHRFATEKTISIDTTAAGGNASLVCLEEE